MALPHSMVLASTSEQVDALRVTEAAPAKKERKGNAKGASSVSSGVRLEGVTKVSVVSSTAARNHCAAGLCSFSVATLSLLPGVCTATDVQGPGAAQGRLLGGEERRPCRPCGCVPPPS